MTVLHDSTLGQAEEAQADLARLSVLNAPIDTARGLPNSAFTSQAYFEQEQKRLFARSWIYAGRASAIPQPGDIIPVSAGGQPICLARQTDGTVEAFYNVCPHRGARLVSAPVSQRKTIVCPYHAWTYGLDGELRIRPHYFGPNQHETLNAPSCHKPRLFPVRSANWLDWIFVNLDGQAPPFKVFLAPVRKQWGNFDLTDVKFAHQVLIDFRANWKLVIENYFDFYHVFKVHPTFDGALSQPLRQPTKGEGHFLYNHFWEKDAQPFVARGTAEPTLPALSAVNESGVQKCVFGVLFPSTAINVHATDLQFTHLEPLAPDHTRMHRYFYFMGEAATSSRYHQARAATYEAWTTLLNEDVGICEHAQEGRHCNAYDGGRFAPAWDSGAHYFHKLAAEAVALETNHHPIRRCQSKLA